MAGTEGSSDAFHRAEAHTVEQNVEAMAGLADLTMANEGAIRELEGKLRGVIGEGASCR